MSLAFDKEMNSSRIAINFLGLIVLVTVVVCFVFPSSSCFPSLSADQLAEVFSHGMEKKQIFETLRRLGVIDFTHEAALQPGFWNAENMPERRYSEYDGIAADELSRTVCTITFNQAVGADILSFSIKYLSGTFLLDFEDKLVAFRTRSYNEALWLMQKKLNQADQITPVPAGLL